MSKTRANDPGPETVAQPSRDDRAKEVCQSVVRLLGRPLDLFRISAIRLWDNQYRVNVQTGADVVSARVSHSFFVLVDEKGNVVESNPSLARVY
ncbi:MAG TPA: hypothetical protein VLM40_13830 [Gemmata sp.]|nr:hypothetical protein [Gemmata sp.]